MAYKVQAGTAILSGTLEQEGDIIIQADSGAEVVRLDQDGTVSGSGQFTVQSLDINGLASINNAGSASFSELAASGLSTLDGGIDVNAAKFTVSDAGAVAFSGSLNINGLASIDDEGSGSLSALNLNSGHLTSVGDITATNATITSTLRAASFSNLNVDSPASIDVFGQAQFQGINNSNSSITNAGSVSSVSALSFVGEPLLAGHLTCGVLSSSNTVHAKAININSSNATINTAGTASVTRLNTIDVSGSGDLELGGATLKMDNLGNGTSLAMGADSLLFKDAGTNSFHTASFVQLASALAGGGLTSTNGVLSTQAAAIQEVNSVNLTLKEGYNFMTASAALTLTLPASPSNGDLVVVKVSNLDAVSVTVTGSGVQTIDGEELIIIESPYSAVSLVYHADNQWMLV
mgnify:FL=1